jgi:hypothetical protein
MDWLLTPVSGASEHTIAPWAYWHARAMVLAWGVLIPAGALMARFFKVTPQQDWPRVLDNRTWWDAHRRLQWCGVLCMTLGLALAWRHAGSHAGVLARLHGLAGWALVMAGWLQIALSAWRGSKGGPTSEQLRGDHYDMTPKRQRFERLHKSLGWLSLCAAIPVVFAGLWLVDAPRWMPIVLAAWWCLLGGAFAVLQRQGRCIDTYQAIWGPETHHPGNQLAPIGWGVRRPLNPDH